jgi:hypothetical protein
MRLALALLVSATALVGSASAECAWVLWIKRKGRRWIPKQPPSPGWGPLRRLSWEVIQAESSQKGCDAALASTTKIAPPPNMTVRYVCLPDTVDPGGPKSK